MQISEEKQKLNNPFHDRMKHLLDENFIAIELIEGT